jgi:hypothetical protein
MVHALANLGRCKIFIGPIDEAIPPQQQAIRLSPRDPSIGFWYYGIGQAHLLQSRLGRSKRGVTGVEPVEPGHDVAGWAGMSRGSEAGFLSGINEGRRVCRSPII